MNPRASNRWLLSAALAALTAGLLSANLPARGGGPIDVGGPTNGISGQPFTWNLAALPNHAIPYRVDSGPMSVNPSGQTVIDNPTGLARVQAMFQTWQNVPTSSVAYAYAGPILAAPGFAGGDVRTASDFNAVFGDCKLGNQSPVIFDADGSLVAALIGDPSVVGFTVICDLDPSSGHILAGLELLNGIFQDGINNGTNNFELTANQFNQAFVHEFGHFSGLDHSQINVEVLNQVPLQCNPDDVAGLPVLFPILICQDRVSSSLPPLAPDDMAWISALYPVSGTPPAGKTLTASAYGTITGSVFFSDGITPAQGVNVIARLLDNPNTPQNESLRTAVSSVSGYLFTGDPGQSVTCSAPDPNNPECNVGGSSFGSRDPSLMGRYNILVPPGTYTLHVESINSGFTGASRLQPLDPPIPMPGQAPSLQQVTVTAGQSVIVNISLSGTPPRFDQFETRLWNDILARLAMLDSRSLLPSGPRG